MAAMLPGIVELLKIAVRLSSSCETAPDAIMVVVIELEGSVSDPVTDKPLNASITPADVILHLSVNELPVVTCPTLS
jgi:hypothetical protein